MTDESSVRGGEASQHHRLPPPDLPLPFSPHVFLKELHQVLQEVFGCFDR